MVTRLGRNVHGPPGGIKVGWEEVRAGWEQAAQGRSEGQVSLDDLVVLPIADDVAYTVGAYTVGTEHGQVNTIGVDQRVTTIYRREGGEWKVVHHHTDQALGS
jgi:ketosteroid isomerase-like protein